MHVIDFFATQFAEVSRYSEYLIGIVDVNMDPGFSFAASENERVANPS